MKNRSNSRHFFKALSTFFSLMLVFSLSTVCIYAEPESTEAVPAEEAAPTTYTIGEQGDHVADMQRKLITLGFYDSISDGDYGEFTDYGVQNFRTIMGIPGEGVDPGYLEILNMIFGSVIYDSDPTALYSPSVFRNLLIMKDESGKYFTYPGTISERAIDAAKKVLMSIEEKYYSSTNAPANDVDVYIYTGGNSLPEGLDAGTGFVSLSNASSYSALTGTATVLYDATGNTITIDPSGVLTSDTGNVQVQYIDYYSGEICGDIINASVSELNTSIPEGMTAIGKFRNLTILNDAASGNYSVSGVVSAAAMNEARKIYAAISVSFSCSDAPASDTMDVYLRISASAMPENISTENLRYEEGNGCYYVPFSALQAAALSTGSISVIDAGNNVVTVFADGSINTDTSHIEGCIIDLSSVSKAVDLSELSFGFYNTLPADQISGQDEMVPASEPESTDIDIPDDTDPVWTEPEYPSEEPVVPEGPTEEPSEEPTEEPSEEPIEEPSEEPIEEPSEEPSEEPTEEPSEEPTEEPSEEPIEEPSEEPSEGPSEIPPADPYPEQGGDSTGV